MGTVPNAVRPHQTTLNTEEDVEFKKGRSEYTIAVARSGYLSQSKEIVLPNPALSELRFRLAEKPKLIVSSFTVSKSIEQSPGAMQWLWDNFFSNERGLSDRDFQRLGQEVARALAESLSETDSFRVFPQILDNQGEGMACPDENLLKQAASEGVRAIACGQVGIAREQVDIKVLLIRVSDGRTVCIERTQVDPRDFPQNVFPAIEKIANSLSEKHLNF